GRHAHSKAHRRHLIKRGTILNVKLRYVFQVQNVFCVSVLVGLVLRCETQTTFLGPQVFEAGV
ncbi:unnamed protein product, partial [Ixodes pacificus]